MDPPKKNLPAYDPMLEVQQRPCSLKETQIYGDKLLSHPSTITMPLCSKSVFSPP